MRKEKPLLLDEIKQKIDASTAMIVTRYDRLEPNLSWKFRSELAKKGSQFEVLKKRVFLKAVSLSGVQIDGSSLKGHVGVVFVNQPDAMAPAKAIFDFSESNGKILEILCGSIDGKLVPGPELQMLSQLPGIDEMRAIMLGLFTMPMSLTLSVLEAKLASEPSSVVIEQN